MKPIIGITTGEILNAKFAWAPYVYGQSHTYVEAIKSAGGVPVLLPFLQDKKDIAQLVATLDGVLFSGGNDVTPEFYGEEVTHAVETSRARDEWELALIDEAQKQDKPIFTICRGTQLLNVSRGGTLYQDIQLDRHSQSNHSSSEEFENAEHLAHTITLEADSKLSNILGEKDIQTNSQHHQAIKKLGKGLIVTARAEDGVVEGVEDSSKAFVMGVQSHPEGLFASAEPKWARLFEAFIGAAKK